jgi:ketosteroid isomerase-like protein
VSVEANKEVVRRYIASFSDPTGEDSAELLNPTARLQIMSRSSGHDLPQAMTKEEYLEFRRERRPKILPNGVRHEVRSMIGEGNWVAAETECFADLSGGRVYNNLFHFLFEIRDGRIEQSREYTDFLYVKQTVFAD